MRERSCACQFGHQFIRLEDKMADGATPFERANPDARKGERPFAPIYPLFNPFARASRRRIGSERARSWFGKAAIDVVGDTLTLELPTSSSPIAFVQTSRLICWPVALRWSLTSSLFGWSRPSQRGSGMTGYGCWKTLASRRFPSGGRGKTSRPTGRRPAPNPRTQ